MNLDVVWKKLVIDADNGSIELVASPEYVTLATEVGLFIWFIYKEDTATLSDGMVFSFGKLLTDTPFVSDAQARAFGKYAADTLTAMDARTLAFGKGLFDTAAAADALAKSMGKLLPGETATAVDSAARTFGKFLTSTATATDDLDGEATTEDDQEIQFFKVLNHTTSAADTKTLTVDLAKADTTNASDAGSLRSQNYCDFTYFAEDYVGQSRTF
jgi:hypothetical protein